MTHSHVPRPVRRHWWQLWRPRAPVYRMGTQPKGLAEYMTEPAPWKPGRSVEDWCATDRYHKE